MNKHFIIMAKFIATLVISHNLLSMETKIIIRKRQHEDSNNLEQPPKKIKLTIINNRKSEYPGLKVEKDVDNCYQEKSSTNNCFNKEPYQCISCKKKYYRKINVYCHIEAKHAQLKSLFTCEHCGKIFIENFCITKHAKSHTEEKFFKCNHCDYKFAYKWNCDRHEEDCSKINRNRAPKKNYNSNEFKDLYVLSYIAEFVAKNKKV